MLDIMIAELIEGNYVLYQGDLSTEVWETLRIGSRPAARLEPALWGWESSADMSARLWPGPGK
ncbi:MAG: hypothetical protein ACN6O6_18705 [Pseudomonas sp.]|uniref:hypothetical protein n=1 Tax=Pseudomonas sp. TaxID=306 RepID=UPI003D0E3701